MSKYAIWLMCLSIGIALGVGGYFWAIHTKVDFDKDRTQLIEQVLTYSNTVITEENDSCEGPKGKRVGHVVASIFGLGHAYTVNPISAGCGDSVCTITLNHCKPWQDAECSSRILRFDQNNNGDIDPSSFICLDLP